MNENNLQRSFGVALLCALVSLPLIAQPASFQAPGPPGPPSTRPAPGPRPQPSPRPQPGPRPSAGGSRPQPGRPSPGQPGRPGPGQPGGPQIQPVRPGNGNRPKPPRPNPGNRPGPRPPYRPGHGGRPPNWGRPPQNRPPYSFRPNDRDFLRRHYYAHLRYINRARRPVFTIGGYFPVGDIGYLTAVPVGLYGSLPPIPPGYQIGYFDGYVVVYDPVTYFIANLVDLLQ